MLRANARTGETCSECGKPILQGDMAIQHLGAEILVLHLDCARYIEQALAKDIREAYEFIARQSE